MMKLSVKAIVSSIAIAGIFTAVAGYGLLEYPDGTLSDRLYHHASASDGEIVVIGMDQRALDALGPMPWPRSYMADAINYLNADPEQKPAVIGIDVLYVGESADPDGDAALVAEGEEFYMDSRAVLAWDAPFAPLDAATETGHINAMVDEDGILRHGLLYVDTLEEERVYSFSRKIFERYAEEKGITPRSLPQTQDGFFYLPYTSAPGGYYDGVSILDLLEGKVDASYFADKIVLIGPYAAGLQDEYRTSIDHAAPMYVIEIQANQIDAFRSGFLPQEVPQAIQLILLFCISFLALLWFRDRKVSLSVAAWLAVSLSWIGLCVILYRSG